MCSEALSNMLLKFDADVRNWINNNQEFLFQKEVKFQNVILKIS